jgi:3-methyladenine DNA glycosylase/8-oxoguanine DNA glycosylase
MRGYARRRTIMPIVETVELPISGALDLRSTLRPLHGWFADDGWWLTARTPEGPGTLRIRRTRDYLIGESWGDGGGWLLASAGAIGGLNDDPTRFSTDHPLVADLHHRHLGMRFGSTGLVFDALVAAIVGQKVTGSEAMSAMRGLRRVYGDPAPGPRPGLSLPPDPERLAAAPYWALHELHLEKRRADVLRRVSRDFVSIEATAGQSPAIAAPILERHIGVGPWTVAKTLMVSHGDPDQVEVGDFHVKHIVVSHMTGRPRGSDEEMLELLEPFRPQRGRVIRLLHTLGHEPKFGPRMAPRDITTI